MKKEAILKECILRNSPMKHVNIAIDENINLVNDLGYDSMSYIKLIVDLQQTFNYKFKDNVLIIENFTYRYFHNELCK